MGAGRPVALVTGAAQGIGAAVAEGLRSAGHTVVTSDVRAGCDDVVDVADAAQVRAWVDAVLAREGRVDVAVANAGLARATSPLDPWDRALHDFREVVGVNLAGAFHLGRAVAPAMAAAGRGHIVLVSTDHVVERPGQGTGGGARMDLYDAAKWGLRGLVEAWAIALAPHGVRVNALCMGATDTPMLRDFLPRPPTDEQRATWLRPEDVAGALVDLVGEGPGGRSGTHVHVRVG